MSDGDPLQIRARSMDGGTTLCLTGVLDFATSETLTVELAKAPIEDGSITLDLTEVDFVDSTGIALLVSVFRHFNAEDRGFKLIPSRAPAVRRVMEVTGLDRTFPFSTES